MSGRSIKAAPSEDFDESPELSDEDFARAVPYPVWEARRRTAATLHEVAAKLRAEADRLEAEADELTRP